MAVPPNGDTVAIERAPARRRNDAAVYFPGGSKLGLHELAYLRAIAQGISVSNAAKRFLLLPHGNAASSWHRHVVDRARAVARRSGERKWRLIGLALTSSAAPGPIEAGRPQARIVVPSVEEWAETEGLLDGWSWDELVEMHRERFGAMTSTGDGAVDHERRRLARNSRLVASALAAIKGLELGNQCQATAADLLDGWIEERAVTALEAAGITTLGGLALEIDIGGRWWSVLPAYGVGKASRLEAHLRTLLNPWPKPKEGCPWDRAGAVRALEDVERGRRPTTASHLPAESDADAVSAWLEARTHSPHTVRSYSREAEKFRIWCAYVHHCSLGDVTVRHCRDYISFLENVPRSWMSRRGASSADRSNWAPFKGQPTLASRGHALTVLRALFGWLHATGYLSGNPWLLLNLRLGDDPLADDDPTSRAFTREAWKLLIAYAEQEAASAATPEIERNLWLLVFGSESGLRAAELQTLRRGDFRTQDAVTTVTLMGKGRKQRRAVVTTAGMKATRRYLATRGLDYDNCPSDTPILASKAGEARLGYSSLYKSLKRLLRRASQQVSGQEAQSLINGSIHWLRHTFATRAAERGVDLQTIQEQLGQSDPRTASGYSRAQMRHRARTLEAAASLSDE